MKRINEIEQMLDLAVPAIFIGERNQSGQNLVYVEGHYVIRRANEVFGHLNWDTKIISLETLNETRYDKLDRDGNPMLDFAKNPIKLWTVTYKCVMEVTVRFLGDDGPHTKVIQDVGFGSGINKDLGSAHEGAGKEARTDALKRCLKDLGDCFGLHTYDDGSKTIPERVKDYKKKYTLDGILNNEAEFLTIQNLLKGLSKEEKVAELEIIKSNYPNDGSSSQKLIEDLRKKFVNK